MCSPEAVGHLIHRFGANWPVCAFCECRTFNKLPVFKMTEYFDSPRFHPVIWIVHRKKRWVTAVRIRQMPKRKFQLGWFS
jgi:hypothetical protein